MAKKSKDNSLNSYGKYLSQIKWGESYTSLFLGAVVVVVALILIFSFFKSSNLLKNTGSTSTTAENETTKYPKSYTVKEGDNLWEISEKIYGSGYNWTDIAKTNNLSSPNYLHVGKNLSIPSVSPKQLTIGTKDVEKPKPITESNYTVVKGDYLWEISIRAYGDGYRWIEIAKVNKLSNPDLIYPGNKLSIPRK